MEVILLADVANLGSRGQVVQVADGYARNYLFPRGLAVPATAGRLKELNREQELKKQKERQAHTEAEKLARRLERAVVTVSSRAGEGGKLFGSVTNKEISQAIKESFQVDIDRRKIELEGPIKALGTYPAVLKLHPQVQAHIRVQVVAENEKNPK
ncbi:MAG: large subunit ribosomal protein [Clostridia bacterium]|nr:large subunit ribosomal protein [Clostridia bacterium]